MIMITIKHKSARVLTLNLALNHYLNLPRCR